MASTKVLVVDDSLTMRALISGVLERVGGIDVVGMANGADEARAEVKRLRPDVMTLDIEMPGMSGIEYLDELMHATPMPVIMFSTRTEAGAEASIEALRLGAIDCFPKPKVASASELDAIVGKLGARIKTAPRTVSAPRKKNPAAAAAPFAWNGRLVAIGADASGTQALFDLLGSYPANCPPTIVVQHLGQDLTDAMIRKLDAHVAPKVVGIEDGTPIEQGKVYLARPGDAHVVVDKWPDGRLRMLPRDPVAGERPSISLLFAGVAKAATADAVGVLLTSGGEDGPPGLKALIAAGGHVLATGGVATPDSAGTDLVLHHGATAQPADRADLASAVLGLCRA